MRPKIKCIEFKEKTTDKRKENFVFKRENKEEIK